MRTEDQADVIAFLRAPSTHGGMPVEVIETHASVVFLAGPRALKLKRAVRYDYLDFSTAERRRLMCEAEFRINRAAAPEIYQGVIAVTRGPEGALALDGSGDPVESLLVMTRFDQDGLFDRLAEGGLLPLALMPGLAAAVAELHAVAERRTDHGGTRGMTWVIDGNAAGFGDDGLDVVDPAAGDRLLTRSREAVARHGPLLDLRQRTGFVRQCHGDLHLRNIVLLNERVSLFDAVEFNDEIACVDVLYDLAFLMMDLWHRRLPHHANVVLNEYLSRTADFGGLALLPLFLSCRAAVRAKTSLVAATLHGDPNVAADLRSAARAYLEMAETLLRAAPPCLVAIGGLSGSGKSTLAMTLAPHLGAAPGAVVLRSDVVRKRLFGAGPHDSLGPDGYTADVNRRVYDELSARAIAVVANGQAAIVDAVYARRDDRDAIERAARSAGVPLAGLWLDAPAVVLTTRVEGRTGDASDADAAVVQAQAATDPGVIAWPRLNAAVGASEVARVAVAALRTHFGPTMVHDPRR